MLDRLVSPLPLAAVAERAQVNLERLCESVTRFEKNGHDSKSILNFINHAQGAALLSGLLGCSPFLTQSLIREIEFFHKIITDGPEQAISTLMQSLETLVHTPQSEQTLVKTLRIAKRRMALTVALADLGNLWPLETITETLSDFATVCLEVSTACLLRQLADRGLIVLGEETNPTANCGFFILGMGKLGARELNYSSDIDIILLYDPEGMNAVDPDALRMAMPRAVRSLMRLMDERTADGYVFRTDLRLRPDPASTPLALPLEAAQTYYESMAQGWERAAMIKARPVAGDIALGERFLSHIRPFVWRKHLDFAAIDDIHAIKQQICAHRGGKAIALAGHDIKTGSGGIREIEFFAQTQQLIWGGRNPNLRDRRTCATLASLCQYGHISKTVCDDMISAYKFLRRLEHRIQMVADKQTQKLPALLEEVEAIARFMGYSALKDFQKDLWDHMQKVEAHYAALFEEDASKPNEEKIRIPTGGEAGQELLDHLLDMGFNTPETIAGRLIIWRAGRYRALRSSRAQELLDTLLPYLLRSFVAAANPDEAFLRFDRFLEGLPAGIQLFSLLQAHPSLLDLLAEVMGTAPRLSQLLTRHPILLDSVLSSDFFQPLGEQNTLSNSLSRVLEQAQDYQDVLDGGRRWAGEIEFQMGVQLLRGLVDGENAGPVLTQVAETILNGLLPYVERAFAETQKRSNLKNKLAVVAFGKLGGWELLPGSDLDLVYVYEAERGEEEGVAPTVYNNRLCQRIGTALSSQTGEGQLYEVDNRLRPAGKAGPLATSLEAFQQYYESERAWIWEHMALTRARPIYGPPDLCERLTRIIHGILIQPRDPMETLKAVGDMRARIARQYPGTSPWDIKHRPGGLVDVEFIVQGLQIIHAHKQPTVLSPNTGEALNRLVQAGVLAATDQEILQAALSLWRRLQAVLRLTATGGFAEDKAPEGQKQILMRAGNAPDFATLKQNMDELAVQVRYCFQRIILDPARK